MDLKTITIIALIIFIVYSYNNPEGSKNIIDTGKAKIQSIIGNYLPNSNPCPSEENLVCYNGVTYQNECYAKKAGAINVSVGECTNG